MRRLHLGMCARPTATTSSSTTRIGLLISAQNCERWQKGRQRRLTLHTRYWRHSMTPNEYGFLVGCTNSRPTSPLPSGAAVSEYVVLGVPPRRAAVAHVRCASFVAAEHPTESS